MPDFLRMKKVYLFFLVFISIHTIAQNQKYSKVKFHLDAKEHSLKKLSSIIGLDHGDYKKNEYFISDFSESDIAKARQYGFNAEILIEDVSSYYAKRKQDDKNQTEKLNSACGNAAVTALVNTPSNFSLGSMGGFYTYAELQSRLDSMISKYPNLISAKMPIDTLTTHEGRPVYWFRISDNPNSDENEPEVLYTALHHAREPASMQQLVFYMWYLLENYNTHPMIKQLVDNTEMYFIPCVNPDGYIYNETTNPTGGGMWRKNRKVMGGGTFGVDLNRNYAQGFGFDDTGSSPDSSQDTYRGPFGFSEPETQLTKKFCNDHQFKIAVNYHTYGNFVVYPWAYLNPVQVPDSVIYTTYGNFITKDNNYNSGTAIQTVGYTANGGSDDWMFAEQNTKGKIYSFTPEAGDASDGFWPAQNRIIDICKVNVTQNIYAAQLAGKYATTADLSPGLIAQQNGYFHYSVQSLGLDTSATFTVSILPLDNLITATGAPKSYNNLSQLQTVADSISFTLDPAISNGQVIQYVLRINNGLYDVDDTIRKIYGSSGIAYTNNCNTITGWTSSGGTWGVTNTQYVSAPSSITDSPGGQYSNNTNKTLTLNSAIDLSNCVSAKLNFWAKWDIETGWDYAEVLASNDNGTSWTPLCGNYTITGNANQDYNQPLYDALQNNWVYEEMDLGMYVGQQIKLRFKLVSDQYQTGDGFYFDDLKVTKISSSPNAIVHKENTTFNLYPNPVKDELRIYGLNPTSTDLYIYNAIGELVKREVITGSSGNFNISELSEGIYVCKVGENIKRFVVVR